MQNQFNEQELLYIIKNYSKILNLFENHNQKQTQVIILIGATGAGKSTLFNFLSGAEFETLALINLYKKAKSIILNYLFIITIFSDQNSFFGINHLSGLCLQLISALGQLTEKLINIVFYIKFLSLF